MNSQQYPDIHRHLTPIHYGSLLSFRWCTMKVVTICCPESYIEGVDKLIKSGMYPNRSEVIRIAIRDLLVDELWTDRKQTSTIPLIVQIKNIEAMKDSPSPSTPSTKPA